MPHGYGFKRCALRSKVTLSPEAFAAGQVGLASNKSAMLIESEKKHVDQYIYLVNKGNHPKMALILVSEIL